MESLLSFFLFLSGFFYDLFLVNNLGLTSLKLLLAALILKKVVQNFNLVLKRDRLPPTR